MSVLKRAWDWLTERTVLPPPPWPQFVYDGRSVPAEEQKALVAVWMGNAIGICPSFSDPDHRKLRVPAEALAARGVLYLAKDGESPNLPPGYAFKSREWEEVAELIFDRWRERGGGFGFADELFK